MKKFILTAAMFVLFTNILNAQVEQEDFVKLNDFTKIEVKGDFTIHLIQSDFCGLIDHGGGVKYDVSRGTLSIRPTSEYEQNKYKQLTRLTVYFSSLESLNLSGAVRLFTVHIVSPTTIADDTPITGQKLLLDLSGASEASLVLNYDEIIADLSGAAKLELRGTANKLTIDGSGASKINAEKLITQQANIDLSGASSAKINTREASGDISGASSLTLNPNAKDNVSRSGASKKQRGKREVVKTDIFNDMDSTYDVFIDEILLRSLIINRNPSEILIFQRGTGDINHPLYSRAERTDEGNLDSDFTTISFGSGALFNIETPNYKRKKKEKFVPSYGYVDFGFSSYGQDFFQHNLPEDYETMQLKQNVSFVFNINFLQYGIRLGSNNFGIGTGAGIGWNSYRFLNESVIPMRDRDEGIFIADPYDGPEDRKYSRSTLRTCWLKVPLYLNYQKSDFFVTAGVVGNVRLGAMSRQIYSLPGSSRQRVKTKDNFYLNAFRMDTELRFGYKDVGFFATYSLTEMFLKNRGPELYPFSFGITLGV